MRKNSKIAIVGAGASGMMSAIICARLGASVTVFEKNEKAGKKIYASGNGRCNITNVDVKDEYFHSNNPQVISKVLKQFSKKETIEFFKNLGIELIEHDDGRIYPLSRQASIVVEQMLYALKKLDVTLHLNLEVEKIVKHNSHFSVFTHGKNELFDKVIISAGGMVASHLGGTESGYKLAKNLGHSLVTTKPSLVQLDSKHKCLRTLKGVRQIAEVSLLIDSQNVATQKDDLLFTDYGLSGPTILKLSAMAIIALNKNKKVEISIRFLPDFSKSGLVNILKNFLKIDKQKDMQLHVSSMIHKKIAKCILKETNSVEQIVQKIQDFRVPISASHGFKTAETTIGGISFAEIDLTTLESKIHNGLYFAGEVLDVDADLGGYNLQWAWSSAYVAARSALSS